MRFPFALFTSPSQGVWEQPLSLKNMHVLNELRLPTHPPPAKSFSYLVPHFERKTLVIHGQTPSCNMFHSSFQFLKPVQKEFVAPSSVNSASFSKQISGSPTGRHLLKTGPGSCPFYELKSCLGEGDQNLQISENTTGDCGSIETPSLRFCQKLRADGREPAASGRTPLGSQLT